jgi:hypothetical protein
MAKPQLRQIYADMAFQPNYQDHASFRVDLDFYIGGLILSDVWNLHN